MLVTVKTTLSRKPLIFVGYCYCMASLCLPKRKEPDPNFRKLTRSVLTERSFLYSGKYQLSRCESDILSRVC